MSLTRTQNSDTFVTHAEMILAAADQQRHIQPLTEGEGAFGLPDAYRVTASTLR